MLVMTTSLEYPPPKSAKLARTCRNYSLGDAFPPPPRT